MLHELGRREEPHGHHRILRRPACGAAAPRRLEAWRPRAGGGAEARRGAPGERRGLSQLPLGATLARHRLAPLDAAEGDCQLVLLVGLVILDEGLGLQADLLPRPLLRLWPLAVDRGPATPKHLQHGRVADALRGHLARRLPVPVLRRLRPRVAAASPGGTYIGAHGLRVLALRARRRHAGVDDEAGLRVCLAEALPGPVAVLGPEEGQDHLVVAAELEGVELVDALHADFRLERVHQHRGGHGERPPPDLDNGTHGAGLLRRHSV
mmetsp:Transcript_114382/g.334405  ORF Transcript_114382/g.334405 Transcript_114382/m.334405 type:complete len:266 (+) Transcript_114382:642-1439(+)